MEVKTPKSFDTDPINVTKDLTRRWTVSLLPLWYPTGGLGLQPTLNREGGVLLRFSQESRVPPPLPQGNTENVYPWTSPCGPVPPRLNPDLGRTP